MQHSLTKNSLFNIVYTGTNILFSFITLVYAAHILLPEGSGKVSAAQNIVSYFVTIAALGLPSYGVREFSKVRDKIKEKNRLYTELLLLNTIATTISLVFFFSLVFLNHTFDSDRVLYLVCGLTIAFNYFNIDWMYKGLEEFGLITGKSVLIKLIALVTMFAFVKTKQDYIIYAFIFSFANGGNYILNFIDSAKFVHFDFSGISLKKHIRPLCVVACIIFLSSIYNKIDVTMLKYMTGDEAVGYYTNAQNAVGMVITITNALTASLLPRLSFLYEHNKNEFYNLIEKGFQILCILTIPFSVGLFITAFQAVQLVFGEAFLPAALTIRIMCPLILIKGFGDLFCYQVVYSTKSEKIILPASGTASIINVILNSVLIPD